MAHAVEFIPDDQRELRNLLKRHCAPTIEAACAYRSTGDAGHLSQVVDGIVAHFARQNPRLLQAANIDGLRLVEDLSFDSLTVLEILFLAEEALGMSIENEEIRTVHTVGDIKRMVIAKSRGRAPQPGLAAVAAT